MTIDERLEKLTERHEALAQSMELTHHDIQQLGEYIRTLGQNSAVDREHIHALVRAAEADGEHIRALVRIVEIHEQRLTDLEG